MTRLKRKYSEHTLNSNFENSIKLINIGSSGNLFLIRYPLATFLDILILCNDLYVIRINYFSWKCVRENEMISWFVFSFGGYNLSWDFDPKTINLAKGLYKECTEDCLLQIENLYE